MLLSDPVDLIYISQVGYIYAVGVLKDHELKRSYKGNPSWVAESRRGLPGATDPSQQGALKAADGPEYASLISAALCLSEGVARMTHALRNHPFPR